jgi:hypothetical protein
MPPISELPPDIRAAVELLRHMLNEKGRPRRRRGALPQALDHVLRPVAALHEIALVCESVLGGRRPPGSDDRRSLKDDVTQSLNQLGKQTKRSLQPDLAEYQKTIKQIDAILGDPATVQRLLAATRAMSERIVRPIVAQAIWRDLVAAVRNGLGDETYGLYLQQLRELQERLGHSWLERATALRTSVRAGDFRAGEEILGKVAEGTAQVAWFIFGNADVPSDTLRVGQAQFFSERVWPDQVRDPAYFAGLPDAEFPAELSDQRLLDALKPGDHSTHHVYARVELVGPRARYEGNPAAAGRSPLHWARALVTSVIEVATHGSGGSRWVLLEGGIVCHGIDSNGNRIFEGIGGFPDPAHQQALADFRPAPLEDTADRLQGLDSRLAEKIAAGEPRTVAAVREARWHHSVRRQNDPAQRVALHVRAFEQALPVGRGEHWDEIAKVYFREFWAWDQFHLAIDATQSSSRFWIELHDQASASQIITWIIDGWVYLGRFLAATDIVGDALREIPGDARVIRLAVAEVGRWARDPAKAASYLDKLRGQFDILLARAQRQRNAIIHGVQTDPDVVASVDRFVSRLADYITVGALHSAAVGEDLTDALERSRIETRRRIWQLKHGISLSEILTSDGTEEAEPSSDDDSGLSESDTEPAGS